MHMQELITQAEKIRPGDHMVALYQEETEIVDYITSYISSALKRKERCVYITGDADTSLVLQQLGNLSDGSSASGDLVVFDRTDTYSKEGKFCPDKLILMIKLLVETALNDGYKALAITGEISWVLDYDDGRELIIEYEWKLNEFIFDKYPVSALCRYNMKKFSDEMIINIIQLHPIIIWKNRIHENPYYIPPEGYKNNTIAEYQVNIWLNNINNFTDAKSRFKSVIEKNQEEMRLLHKNMTNGIIMAMLKLLETHDPYTKNHCLNVASLAKRLAERLNMTQEFNTIIFYAALVHDIGKTIIPRDILNKPGKLTDEEYEYIKKHSAYGAKALDQVEFLHEIALAVLHHHEYYNGTGYPEGISGEQIPLMSRILSICDSYDAMTNERPYRKAQSQEIALKEIVACAGKQFDPFLVKQFVMLFVS